MGLAFSDAHWEEALLRFETARLLSSCLTTLVDVVLAGTLGYYMQVDAEAFVEE